MNESFDLTLVDHYTVPKGIVHIGAHHAEELSSYRGLPTVWVEGHPEYAQVLAKKVARLPGQIAIEAVLSDEEGEVDFFITRDEFASSLLQPQEHTSYFPHAGLKESIKVKTVRFDTMVEAHGLDMSQYNVLVLDVQGVEDKVIRGMGKYSTHFPIIITEFFLTNDMYRGNTTLGDLDLLLKDDYRRVYPQVVNKLIGDALYVRI